MSAKVLDLGGVECSLDLYKAFWDLSEAHRDTDPESDEVAKCLSTGFVSADQDTIDQLTRAARIVRELEGPDDDRQSASVLITGLRGTGKELAAEALSQLCRGRSALPVNSGGINENLLEARIRGIKDGVATGVDAGPGVFELANGGSIFLDEIGDLPLAQQPMFLRVLQERRVTPIGGKEEDEVILDVLVIAATNKDLDQMRQGGDFREDLIDRISQVQVKLCDLHNRRADLFLLLWYFIKKRNMRSNLEPITHVTNNALFELITYHWPGNVRELQDSVLVKAAELRSNTMSEITERARIGLDWARINSEEMIAVDDMPHAIGPLVEEWEDTLYSERPAPWTPEGRTAYLELFHRVGNSDPRDDPYSASDEEEMGRQYDAHMADLDGKAPVTTQLPSYPSPELSRSLNRIFERHRPSKKILLNALMDWALAETSGKVSTAAKLIDMDPTTVSKRKSEGQGKSGL